MTIHLFYKIEEYSLETLQYLNMSSIWTPFSGQKKFLKILFLLSLNLKFFNSITSELISLCRDISF